MPAPPLNQGDPSKNERAHDAFAELGFSDQQGTQPLGGDQQGLDVAFRRAVHQRRAPGKLTDLGQELTCALLGDGSDMAQAVALGDRDKARQHDEHAGPDFSRFE